MADNVELEVEEPQATGEPQSELEIVVGSEEQSEEKPEVVSLTPEEFAALKAQGDSTRAMREGIEGLASKLQAPAAPPVVNTPEESVEEFFAKHSDEMFDPEKGAKLLKEFTSRTVRKEFGSILTGVSAQLAQTRKELLEAKDPDFKKYLPEVEQLVNAQTPEIRSQANIYEQAWEVVRKKHQSEIESANVDRLVEEKLKALGLDPAAQAAAAPGRPPVRADGAAPVAPGPRTGKTTVRLPSEAVKQALVAEATSRGMEIEDLLRIRGYLK
jgi:hypothetical protein